MASIASVKPGRNLGRSFSLPLPNWSFPYGEVGSPQRASQAIALERCQLSLKEGRRLD